MENELKISGLMSIYHGSKSSELRTCLESIFNQTSFLEELIIVIDGNIPEELDVELLHWKKKIKVKRLEHNQGLGRALNEGLKLCSCNYIMRFDSDDVFYPTRIETQKKYLMNNPNVDILGTWMAEFVNTPNNVVSTRRVPSRDNVRAFAKFRNPINHISVVFKKDSIDLIGGYDNVLYAEDYHLWLKAISAGLVIENLPEITCAARISEDMYKRRSGVAYIKSELKLLLLKKSIYKKLDLVLIFVATILRILIRILPGNMISKIYKIAR